MCGIWKRGQEEDAFEVVRDDLRGAERSLKLEGAWIIWEGIGSTVHKRGEESWE